MNGALNVNGTVTATNFSGSGTGLTGIGTSNLAAITGTPSTTTYLRGDGTWGTIGGTLSGGVASYIPLWTSATAIGTSNIYQNGSNIGIGTAGATFPDVNGSICTNASLFTNTLQTLSTSANMTLMVNGQNAVIITSSVPIEAIKPDLIIFDSIMCLLVGPMQDEATWAPMKPLVCELSARKIAQVWFNHANDLGKSFGDKTREWEMDTTGKLSKVEGDETAIRLDQRRGESFRRAGVPLLPR